jgi:cytochrome c-type biogenesis protein CcmH/NrfF
LLWAGPVVLLVLGLLALVRIVRKRQGLVADAAAIPADADVAARAHALLDDPPTPSRSDR